MLASAREALLLYMKLAQQSDSSPAAPAALVMAAMDTAAAVHTAGLHIVAVAAAAAAAAARLHHALTANLRQDEAGCLCGLMPQHIRPARIPFL